MNEPLITPLAEADLDDIWHYLAGRGARAADDVVTKILAASRRYCQFPRMGQDRADLHPGFRSFVVPPYVIYYRPVAETIEILRIVHGARNVDASNALERYLD